jgi:hypothetical protein
MTPPSAECRARSKSSRSRYPKEPREAACVGEPGTLLGWRRPALAIQAMGRGSYCRTRLDKYGSRRRYCMRTKRVGGFKTDDVVQTDGPNGARKGGHIGRVAWVRMWIVQYR